VHDPGSGIGRGLAFGVGVRVEMEFSVAAFWIERHRVSAIAIEVEIGGDRFHYGVPFNE
jgi:hypothetical protein